MLVSIILISILRVDAGAITPPTPSIEWAQQYEDKFDKLGVANYSESAAHLTHSFSVELARLFYGINIPINNGIPIANYNLTAPDAAAIIANAPSRPTGYESASMHSFVDFMDHVEEPDRMMHGSKLYKALHQIGHMNELHTRARVAADSFHDISEDICEAALDNKNNGIIDSLTNIFKYFKTHTGNTTQIVIYNTPDILIYGHPDIINYGRRMRRQTDIIFYGNTTDIIDYGNTTRPQLVWGDDGESWKVWKEALASSRMRGRSAGEMRSMGLYMHCVMRKFPNTEQPVDVCCDTKTVGEYNYTKVSTGAVPDNCLNNCIYRRDDKPSSKYCFAIGEEKVHCLNEG